jgi:hypothetical protein
MKKVLTIVVVAGLAVYIYNEYKKAKNTRTPQLK